MNQKRRTSWDEGFSKRYDEWASSMTEDVAFYVELHLLGIESRIAEYAVTRAIDGKSRVFFIYFIREGDGVWRLNSM